MKKVKCIMLVDDNPADNLFHKIKITEADVCEHIQIVTDARKALDYLKKAGETNPLPCPKPDLIYLDINMPGMDGFEFLEQYHQLDEKLKARITIIMLTTSTNPDDKKKALENADVSEFQNKPLTVEGLRETIEKYF